MKFLAVLLCISLSASIYAQKKWTLEECINYALENNININLQKLNTEQAYNNYEMSKAGILPSLNAGSNQNMTFGRSVDPFTNEFATENIFSTNMSVSSSVTLFSGFQQYYNVKRSQADYKAGMSDLEHTKNNIMLLISSAYLNILYSMELVDIAEHQVDISRQQLSQTSAMVDAGSLPRQSKYELEAQLSNEELRLVNSKNTLNLALLNLAQILELDNVKDFDIVKPEIDALLSESVLLDVDHIYNEATGRMPQIDAAKYRIESAYMNYLSAKGSRLPRITLNASYGTGYSDARREIDQITIGQPVQTGFVMDEAGSIIYDVYQPSFEYSYVTRPFSDQVRDNASTAISMGISIPIFNGWQTKTNIQNSKIYYKQTQLQAKQVEKDLLQEIQQAHADAKASYKQYSATEKTLKAMETSFEYTEKRFALGLINAVEYNIAKNNLTRTQSELIRAKYEFIFKQKTLEFYRGGRFEWRM